MFKSLTLRDDNGAILTARVMLAVTHPPLRAELERAVLAAIEAFRGAGGLRVVHMQDVGGRRPRPDDAPPPGHDADGGGAPDEEQTDDGNDDDPEQTL